MALRRGEGRSAPLVVVRQVVAVGAETFAVVDFVSVPAGPGALFRLLRLFDIIGANIGKVCTKLYHRPIIAAGHRTRIEKWSFSISGSE